MNPNVMLPPFAGMVPFQWPGGLLAVTVLSSCEYVAFHPLLNRSPAVNIHVNVYPEITEGDGFTTFRSAWKPLFHCVTIR